MVFLLKIVFWLLVGFGGLTALGRLLRRFYQKDRTPDSIHFCQTEDGYRIALSRYRSKGSEPGAGNEAPPVILCPGMGLSGALFDLFDRGGDSGSLAKHLSSRGFDVWVLDPRGRGLSTRPRLFGSRPARWIFDDYADFDVPSALDEVKRVTGSTRVSWVGFGLGALVLFAMLAKKARASEIAAFVGLASPLFFRRSAMNLLPKGGGFTLARWACRPWILHLASPLLGRLAPFRLKLLQNLDNLDSSTIRCALVNASVRVTRAEARQYAGWFHQDRFDSADMKTDFRKGASELTAPALLIHGVRDPLAPPEDIQATLEALTQSSEKKAVLASRSESMSGNYGHLDLLLGRMAPKDIYPLIESWLARGSSSQ
jgi:pimeloyl-ACP methyl ester carboxylesterase